MTRKVKEVTHVTINSHKSIVRHVDVLRHSLPLSYAFRATQTHLTFTLLQNISSSISSWNLGSLAWLLFKELPQARDTLKRSMAVTYVAASPRVAFPVYSSLHTLESWSRDNCSSLHKTSTYFQVACSIQARIPVSILLYCLVGDGGRLLQTLSKCLDTEVCRVTEVRFSSSKVLGYLQLQSLELKKKGSFSFC